MRCCKFKQENQLKASELYQTLLNGLDLKWQKQQDEYFSTHSLRALAFYRKCSDVTPFVIINFFKSNCNLITHFFSVIVTSYSYIYFVIKLRSFITSNELLNKQEEKMKV